MTGNKETLWAVGHLQSFLIADAIDYALNFDYIEYIKEEMSAIIISFILHPSLFLLLPKHPGGLHLEVCPRRHS